MGRTKTSVFDDSNCEWDLFVRAWRRQRGEPARGGTDTPGRGELEGGEEEVEAS
jgi:hypothetical protein